MLNFEVEEGRRKEEGNGSVTAGVSLSEREIEQQRK